MAFWREGLHQPVCSTVLQAVEECPQCFVVCADELAAGSNLSHHNVAAGLPFPATNGQVFLRPSNVADADSPSTTSNSSCVDILSFIHFSLSSSPIPQFETHITPSQF